ncbi:hypothetical protein QUF70_04295 [Desulfobacterales bacterium HSG17]|nr:hypothetical protein [Desulfobacterales bacterium HSG17]
MLLHNPYKIRIFRIEKDTQDRYGMPNSQFGIPTYPEYPVKHPDHPDSKKVIK